jgi:hypothetical protein
MTASQVQLFVGNATHLDPAPAQRGQDFTGKCLLL